jgi:ABC-type uncharacterized transport system ATPase subunit
MFRVSLTFPQIGDEIVARLQEMKPADLQVNGRSIEMTVHSEESSLLAKLAEISRSTPILQFEVRGPSLEEIFVSLVKETR